MIAALVLTLMLGVAAAALGMWSLALLAPIYAAACIVWPPVGVGALIVACALDRVAVGVGGPNVRPDELAALALAGALLVRLTLTRHIHPSPSEHASLDNTGITRPRSASFAMRPSLTGLSLAAASDSPARQSQASPMRGRIPLLAPLLAYVGVNVLATLTAGGDVARGLSLDLITLDLVLLYVALALSVATPARLLGAVYLWLGVAAAEAVVGALVFVLYLGTHATVPGVQFAPDTGAPMVYGTLYEANIFGSYMSAAFLIALALAAEDTVRRKLPLYAVCVLTALGLLLSDTRSAWGATALGAVLLLALLQLGRRGRRARLALRFAGGVVVVAVIVGVGLAVAPSSLTGRLGERIQGLLNFGSGSGYGRVLLYKEALSEWQAHPLLGLGPGSFAYHLPGDNSAQAWLPNLTLQALHDTGVLGLLVMLWLFVAFYIVTIRALRRAPPGRTRAALAGLIAAVSALLIAFQLTPGFTLGYSWALLALAVAASSAIAVQRSALATREAAAA